MGEIPKPNSLKSNNDVKHIWADEDLADIPDGWEDCLAAIPGDDTAAKCGD